MKASNLCPPAFIYIIFSLIQVMIDISEDLYAVALAKLFVGVIFTFMLQVLCESGLDVISWIIVFIPFILKSVIVALLITQFKISPYSGRYEKKESGNIIGDGENIVITGDLDPNKDKPLEKDEEPEGAKV